MKIKIYINITFLLISLIVNAQDPVFTHFINIPEVINPAFVGSGNALNAGLIHRRQWPEANRRIDTQYAFANNLITENVGLGINILNQNESFTNYNYLQINGVFSYTAEISYDWKFRFGLEGGYGRKDFNFQNLLLEDQIDINNETINPVSIDPNYLINNNNINFFDFNSGFLFENDISWFGATIKHMNRPDISFIDSKNIPLDLFLSLHGGGFIELNNSPSFILPTDSSILVTFNYMKQSFYNRLDIGACLNMDNIALGMTLVTNPEGKAKNSHILTSVNPFLLYKANEFTFGYSYDINTSKFGQSQGIHEFSLTWKSNTPCRDCDKFVMKLKNMLNK
ncbi:PorP/SprF family type IX secretion system membrane protein [uncultured Flavobacterium sp.]|uniref:PorP/SprF family type IX secretion system membrane protein n=1 Tax=uncultured Flavobacterium sp. TaxID=165435 RepID=UPI0030CA5A07